MYSMKKLYYKESIRELLEIISDTSKRSNIGAVEIICGWFDDLYFPADDPSIYNPGVYEKGLKEFESCFLKNELLALQSFHDYFSSIVDALDIDNGIDTIQDDPNWVKLGYEALKVLNEFD